MKSKKLRITKGVILSIVLLLALIAVVVIRAVSKKPVEALAILPLVETTHKENRDIIIYTSQIAGIESASSVAIYPQMAGEILSVAKKAGDKVEAGEELATIKSDALSGLKIQMDQARIAMQDAQAAYDRTKSLHDAGGASLQMLEQANSAKESAKLAHSAAKAQYDLQQSYSSIKSPISGTLEKVNIKVHDVAAPQLECFVVNGDEGMLAKFGITEDSKAILKVGDEVLIDYASKKIKAHITEISQSVSDISGLYDVKAGIEDESAISANVKLKVELIDKKAMGVDSIPISAVSYYEEKPYIYVYKDGRAIKKDIEVGIYDESYIEVKSGITAEDEIIYTWSNEIYDNAEVNKKE